MAGGTVSEAARPGTGPHRVERPEPSLPPPPHLLRPELGALAADLGIHDVDDVEAVLGPMAAAALHRDQPAAAAMATAGDRSTLATLVRLFMLGLPVHRVDLDRALPLTGTDALERLGLVMTAGHSRHDEVLSLVDLRPVTVDDAAGRATWWVASDLGSDITGSMLHPEHVLGVGGASTMLARLTVRDPRRRVVDLGTGCGIQALQATRHARSVVATDVSERALAFAAVNAALAGVELDLRRGSLLAPVFGERVDLLVSNPPFVITPRGEARTAAAGLPSYVYRDGGMAGDALVESLVREAGGVLAPGGVAQLLGNWEHRTGEGWVDRVGDWVDGTGMDAWVVQREVLDPAEYAEMWLRDGGASRDCDPEAWDGVVSAWLEDFTARGVEAVGMGFVVLRRPKAGERPRLRRLEEQHGRAEGPLGGAIAAGLAAHDLMASVDDDVLVQLRLTAASDVTEERHLRPGDTDPQVILLRQGGGFGRVVQAGTALAGLVGACRGELTVGQITIGIAALLDVPVDALRSELFPQVRDLIRDGLLEV
ncbi:methyltransferase [Actinotalea sp. M2MS4P-6]|uniref:DUF7059 domain-containing protein n=1 Tax=Actinotalea sp. M2MS4P-6 TaxID=2983762 RepID=UPI0021E36C5F|nr:methyltransferase [Actinotalea sp. M2MS4P-6]MCV2394911.1 methyltransferase [Actinotalea sp. M2MS4P-6]